MSAPTVRLDPALLGPFLRAAAEEYERSTPESPPRCWAILVGRLGEELRVERICFGDNVRETDAEVAEEFAENIIPCFGAAYANKRRGYWCDGKSLLRIMKEAERDGLEVLGSIHLHPDWHRIGPPHERGLRISQHPTPMDRHLFGNTGWPLNLICYVERREGRLYHALGAWAPPSEGRGCAELPVYWELPEAVSRS
jgi:proteasome lid subunit RPN8/RPN11